MLELGIESETVNIINEDKDPLAVEISRITQTGNVYLEFSKSMSNVTDLSLFTKYKVFNLEIESNYLTKAE